MKYALFKYDYSIMRKDMCPWSSDPFHEILVCENIAPFGIVNLETPWRSMCCRMFTILTYCYLFLVLLFEIVIIIQFWSLVLKKVAVWSIFPSVKDLPKVSKRWCWVTQKLPQIYTANHANFPIKLRTITVQICGNFWVTQ